MSLFDDIVNSFYLTEDNAADDEQNTDNQNQNNEPAPAAENQDTGGEEGADDSEEEYQMNDPEADDTSDNGEEGTDDSNSGNEPTDDPSAKLKDIEKSIFDQLSPEQQAAKIKELKSLYTDTYNKCQTIVDMVSSADKEPSQAKVYDYIINNLVDLQKYIRDYLDDIFDSKTYIENMTELQKYLAILDTINNVFEEIKKGSETLTK